MNCKTMNCPLATSQLLVSGVGCDVQVSDCTFDEMSASGKEGSSKSESRVFACAGAKLRLSVCSTRTTVGLISIALCAVGKGTTVTATACSLMGTTGAVGREQAVLKLKHCQSKMRVVGYSVVAGAQMWLDECRSTEDQKGLHCYESFSFLQEKNRAFSESLRNGAWFKGSGTAVLKDCHFTRTPLRISNKERNDAHFSGVRSGGEGMELTLN